MYYRFPILEALKVIFNMEYVFTVDILLGYLSGDKFSLNMPTNIWYSYMGHVNIYRTVRARSRASSRSKPVSLTLRWILQYRRFNMGANQLPETNRKNTTSRIKQRSDC